MLKQDGLQHHLALFCACRGRRTEKIRQVKGTSRKGGGSGTREEARLPPVSRALDHPDNWRMEGGGWLEERRNSLQSLALQFAWLLIARTLDHPHNWGMEGGGVRREARLPRVSLAPVRLATCSYSDCDWYQSRFRVQFQLTFTVNRLFLQPFPHARLFFAFSSSNLKTFDGTQAPLTPAIPYTLYNNRKQNDSLGSSWEWVVLKF